MKSFDQNLHSKKAKAQISYCKRMRADALYMIGTIGKIQGKTSVPPSLHSQPRQSEFFLLRDADQKRQRLVKVRKTMYEDPGNPFNPENNGSTEVLLEQKADEDSKSFVKRSSKWFLEHREVQDWLRKNDQAPDDVTWQETGPTTDIPPVPPIPEDLKSSYVPARAGWTKMKPSFAMHAKPDRNPAAGANNPFDEKRDTAFYTPFHEIEDMYRDAKSTGKKSRTGRSKR